MKLKNQVCTLSQAKKLTELGLNVKSLFQWREYLDEGLNLWQTSILFEGETDDDCIKYALADSSYPALTVAELLLINCETITINNMQLKNSAEQLADHILFRIRNNELSVEACNERLLA